jgi:hypothetical protein
MALYINVDPIAKKEGRYSLCPSLLSRSSGLLCFIQRTEPEVERSAAEQIAKESCVVPLMVPGSSPSLVVNNKKAPSLGPYEWITKETLVYRHSYLNPMSAVFDDVTNCDAGFD